MLKIASWNVNSLKVRLSQVIDWLDEHQPDVLALQETKTQDQHFPLADIEGTGYQAIYSGQKTYNGVALLTRHPVSQVMTDFPNFNDPQRRILAATYGDVRIWNVYVPNGATVDSEKYAYKLAWLEQLHQILAEELKHYAQLIIVGDFNIAPQDCDVYDPASWEGHVLISPKERAALQKLHALGLQDTFRLFEQAEKSFSWWDYRANSFRRNLGARIDLILASDSLIRHCQSSFIDKQPRSLTKPSDHAPVVATFDIHNS